MCIRDRVTVAVEVGMVVAAVVMADAAGTITRMVVVVVVAVAMVVALEEVDMVTEAVASLAAIWSPCAHEENVTAENRDVTMVLTSSAKSVMMVGMGDATTAIPEKETMMAVVGMTILANSVGTSLCKRHASRRHDTTTLLLRLYLKGQW